MNLIKYMYANDYLNICMILIEYLGLNEYNVLSRVFTNIFMAK